MLTILLFFLAFFASSLAAPLPPPSSLLSRDCHFSRCPSSTPGGAAFSSSLIVGDTLVCRYAGSDAVCAYSVVDGLLDNQSAGSSCGAAANKVCQQAQRRYKKEDNFTAVAARDNARAARGRAAFRLGAVKKALSRKRPGRR